MIRLIEVDVGVKSIKVPVAILKGTEAGKTLLITAGNDGDEYAGIAAAYQIIEQFSATQFSGTLIVIPVVNIPGFENETSKNPLDGKYPKHIYPGNENGKPSERLRHWLSEYVKQSDIWMDLHCASLVERVTPYIHVWKNKSSEINERVQSVLNHMNVDYAVYMRVESKIPCGYFMCESGLVSDHLNWIHTAMCRINMLAEPTTPSDKTIFIDIAEYYLKKSGMWYANFPLNNSIKKGAVLGVVKSLDGKIIETITAKNDGTLLWGKEGMRANSGDVVAGVGVI